MKHPVIKLAGILALISGLVVLNQILSSADYNINFNDMSFYYFLGGLILIIFGLVALLFKRRSDYDLLGKEGRTSEGRSTRAKNRTGALDMMHHYNAPPEDGLPADPIEWWK